MTIRTAMPFAHEVQPNYSSYYVGVTPIIRVHEWFGRDSCDGLCVEADPIAPLPLGASKWALYAVTDGFLSFSDDSLVLRLPRELTAGGVRAYNSGAHYRALRPVGPQLRHIVYKFDAAPATADVEAPIRALLGDAAHPMRTVSVIATTVGGRPQTRRLGVHLDAGNLEAVVAAFMAGTVQLFVRAADVIGNFRTRVVDIRFLDSCGSSTPTATGSNVVAANGRPLNPSFFLWMLRANQNSARVTMLTTFPAHPAAAGAAHPLDALLASAAVTAAGGNADQILDVTASTPPRPRQRTVDVTVGATTIAGRGIPIGHLGEWHQSRNAANPFSTSAPVEWRNYGSLAADTVVADYGKFRTQVKAGLANRLPGAGAFDHVHTPTVTLRTRIENYWSRWGPAINVVADAFELPCELFLAIAATETGNWFAVSPANSTEMSIIRMEPLPRTPAQIATGPADRARLDNYFAIAGGGTNVAGAPHHGGANATLPMPWNGNGLVGAAAHPLTWNDLYLLIGSHPADVRVSPGMMQTLVTSARENFTWVGSVYGTALIPGLGITHSGIPLEADAPPATPDALFRDWFGVTVDSTGATTTVAASADHELSGMKRGLHNLVAGAAHMKRRYNTVASNCVCDFDFPTVASGYNDGASSVRAATAADSNAVKWKKLFALRFYNDHYPDSGTKAFNAAIELFNALPAAMAQPEVRLWKR